MSGLRYGDRVQETTTTTGTGILTLLGAVQGSQAFSAVVGTGDQVFYTITDGTNWEVGRGTYTLAGTTLSRAVVQSSSNGGALVNFPAGTKNVWLDQPASTMADKGMACAIRNLWIGG